MNIIQKIKNLFKSKKESKKKSKKAKSAMVDTRKETKES